MPSSDPIPFNPLDLENLAQSVGLALEARPLIPLTGLTEFRGMGLYALYYHGAHPLYSRIVKWNHDSGGEAHAPIYVGRAVSQGTRKGAGFGADPNSRDLFNRLVNHRASIDAATNLDAGDFSVRYLVTMAVWIPLGEASIINRYRPLWNVVVDGFGNHDPGAGRRRGERPRWDVLHPGRHWADLQAPNRLTADRIGELISQHLEAILASEAEELVQR